ncbi:MAG TPA: GNAT family N-acetyltransferase [Xanthomonadales bacterium]|nr:GNAT family N-acetyltransferase [Xanthomonadales bacterium]
MERVRFRLATAEDAEPLAAFMTRNFLAAYGHCSTAQNVAACVAEHYAAAAQRRQLADPARVNVVGCLDGRIAGHAQLRVGGAAPPDVVPLPAVEIARFYVDLDFHGRGVAQAMMADVRERATALGAASLWLSVWQQQPQAIRFYGKEGFRIAGALVFHVGDDPKDDWLMVARVQPARGHRSPLNS